jgi:pimeloyl-[acyl-carrier protein] methyl ester esterase
MRSVGSVAAFKNGGTRERHLQYFTASDGARIAFRDSGSGRPLLLLHGLMAHGGFFAAQKELADEFRLIRVDLRGHGASDTDAPTVEHVAADIEALLGFLGVEGAIGIGWSLGASVLWRLLGSPASDRLAGSVIVDMTPRVLNRDGWDLGLSTEACEARRIAIRQDFGAMAQAAGYAIFAQPLRDDLRATADWAAAEFARNDAAAIAQLWDSLVQQDFRGALASIGQPTLVIHGAHSQLYGPGTADYLTATLPAARSIEFGQSGHAPHMEQPELFNRAIRDFAASLPRARTTHDTIKQA